VYGSAYAPPSEAAGRTETDKSGPGWVVLVLAALVIALVAGLVGGFIGAWLDSDDRGSGSRAPISLGTAPSGSLSRSPESVAGIAQRVLPTVVSIEVRADGSGGTGSGFVLREDGYLLTNNHVVAAAASGGSIRVTFNDGATEDAEIVGRTATYDLAVLKVDRTGLPVADLGNSDAVVVGDTAIAIGSPLGLSGTVTAGIISATDRPVTAGEGSASDISYISALQTDAAINPGNSGGPLVDSSGRVIGVNSAIATLGAVVGSQGGSIGLGFSIPINQARRTAEQLINDGKASYPIMGAVLDPTFTGDGVRIADEGARGAPAVASGGPSDQAGIRPGDVIVAFDGQPVAGPDELIVAIRSHVPGDTVSVTFDRDGREQTVQVTLGEATD
jgi:putative serine protease PepD